MIELVQEKIDNQPTHAAANQPEKKWLLEIKPEAPWYELHLKDLWRYRDLIGMFIYREFVSQYKQTILGPLWFLIQPILTTLMFVVIFGRVAKISTDGMPQILFYMSGLLLWNYFSNCFTKVAETFSTNAHIFGKVYFPRLVVPISTVISTLISFGIQFVLFTCIWVYYYLTGTPLSLNAFVLLIPYLLLLMAALGLGTGIIISSLTIKYRDLKFLVSFGVQLLMYATPVIYPLSSIPAQYRFLISANPITGIVETFRYAVLGKGTFDPVLLGYSSIATMVLLMLGVLLFNRVERNFMDVV
jgi:lipopolysaccharide transport system permease protein